VIALVAFAALGDLLEGVLDDALPRLPTPQRHALKGVEGPWQPGERSSTRPAVAWSAAVPPRRDCSNARRP
jgi:hypothetical protein